MALRVTDQDIILDYRMTVPMTWSSHAPQVANNLTKAVSLPFRRVIQESHDGSY
jgi:hypothetical protein